MGSELVGRATALAPLRLATHEALAGRGRLELIVGEPGIGKTALAAQIAGEAAELGMDVLWSTCWDGDGAPPYWPWVQVIRASDQHRRDAGVAESGLLPELTGGADRQRPAMPGEEARRRFELFDSVATALRESAHRIPVIVVLDDLHWADVPSLLLLNFLVGHVATEPILLLGTFRDDELDGTDPRMALLAQARRNGRVTHLQGLAAVDVERLIESMAGAQPLPRLAADVGQRTGGNPFFVREVTHLLLSRGEFGSAEKVAGVPAGVRQVVFERLARLPQDCVAMLTAVAVVGREVGADLLARISGHSIVEIADRLSEAVSARVLATPPGPAGPYRFVHDLFREALYDNVPPRTRANLHLAVARALQASSAGGAEAQAGELAHHLLLAAVGRPGEVDVADESVRCGILAATEAIRRLAYEDAIGHVERQLRGLDPAGLIRESSRMLLLLARAEARRCSGDGDAAATDYREACAIARQLDDVTAFGQAVLGIQALGVESGGSRAESVGLLEEVLDRLPDADSGLKARILAALARELFLTEVSDRVRAAHLSTAAVELARRLGDDGALAVCLLASHDTIWLPGQATRRRAIAVEMGAVARRAGDRAFEAEACLLRASAELELGDPAGVTHLEEFCRLGEAVAQPRYLYLALTRRVVLAIMAGRFAEADRYLTEAADLADRIGEPDAWNVYTRHLWELCTVQGRRGDAEDQIRSVRLPHLRYWYDALLGLVLLERGDTTQALRVIGSAVLARPEHVSFSYVLLVQWSEMGEAAAAAGLAEPCQRFYDILAPYAGTAALTAAAVGFNGAVDHHLGVLAAALRRFDDAVRHLTAAADMHARLSAWPWLARSSCELAAALVARGRPADRDRAAELLTRVRQLDAEFDLPAVRRRAEAIAQPPANIIRRDGDGWHLAYQGAEIHLRNVKGLGDLASLIRAQGHAIPATVLAAGVTESGLPRFDADPVLDRQAQHQYRKRLAELDAAITNASGVQPADGTDAMVDERAFVARELAAAVGLGQRDRRLGDDQERARKAVTARIKDAVARIAAVHPPLAEHLTGAVSTGILCAYRPTEPTPWQT